MKLPPRSRKRSRIASESFDGRAPAPVLAEGHGAEAERGHAQARAAERDVVVECHGAMIHTPGDRSAPRRQTPPGSTRTQGPVRHRRRHRDPRRVPRRPTRRPSRRPRRASSRSRAASRRRCTAGSCGRCGSTPASARPPNRTAATSTSSRRGARASRSPSICRPRWAATRTTRWRAARSGRVGVAIDSLEDMRVLFDGIPLGEVVDLDDDQRHRRHPARALPGGRRGAGRRARPAARHDPERHPEGVHRARHVHLSAAPARCASSPIRSRYCSREVPQWNTVSISGYHIREAGADAVQEVAFTLANGVAYVAGGARRRARRRRASRRGCRSSSTCTTTSSRRSRKFRAARAHVGAIMRDRFGAKNPRASTLRFHTQTAGVTLQAQQPLVNVVRVTLQALAAVLGGAVAPHQLVRRGARAPRPRRRRGSRCAPSR